MSREAASPVNSLGSRISGSMKKFANLRRSRPTLNNPEESSVSTSASSITECNSEESSASTECKTPPEEQLVKQMSNGMTSPKRVSMCSVSRTTTQGSSALPVSPWAPRILSVQEHTWVHQQLLLVFGQVDLANKGQITVRHHLDSFPATHWPICENGYFKALVHLDPGPNKLLFTYKQSKSSTYTTEFTVQMLPLVASPPLHLVLLVAKDSLEMYECQSEKENNINGLDMAIRKLRMAAYLGQAFTSEQLYRRRFGRRCFRFEEEWSMDTLSNQSKGVMRSIAKVHVLRIDKTVQEIQDLEDAQDGSEVRRVVGEAVKGLFPSSERGKRYVAALVFDAKGDLQIPGNTDKSALSDGLGIVGSRSLYTLPSCIEEVVPTFTDCTRIGIGSPSGSRLFWEGATLALANMMEVFFSPQPPVEARSFVHINRSFVTKEPYSSRTKCPGRSVYLPEEESPWSRLDCVRFRYHPCFRIPTDPIHPYAPDIPQIYPVDNGLVASASSGIVLVLIFSGNEYQSCLEFTKKPEREVAITEDLLYTKLPKEHRLVDIRLQIFTAGQGELEVDDFSVAKSASKLHLPSGLGSAYKSAAFGSPAEDRGSVQTIMLKSLTKGSTLMCLKAVRTETALVSLEFVYDDGSSQLFGAGDVPDTSVAEFVLDARKGECLLGFCLQPGIKLEALTSQARMSAFFGKDLDPHGHETRLMPPRGKTIVGVSGSVGTYLHDFAILYR